jgi:hypothetical protein
LWGRPAVVVVPIEGASGADDLREGESSLRGGWEGGGIGGHKEGEGGGGEEGGGGWCDNQTSARAAGEGNDRDFGVGGGINGFVQRDGFGDTRGGGEGGGAAGQKQLRAREGRVSQRCVVSRGRDERTSFTSHTRTTQSAPDEMLGENGW